MPNDCSADGDHSYLLWASCELVLASYGLKLHVFHLQRETPSCIGLYLVAIASVKRARM